jgi:beta-mannosidase
MKLSLDGTWDYIVDEAGALDPARLPGAGWGRMGIPCNWYLGGLGDYSGVVWFRRTFDAPVEPGREYWLRFHGVDYFARVWLNGVYLGEHEGYFQPFEFRVTGILRPQGNELLVRVDSPREPPGEVWPDRKRLIKGVLNHHDCRPGAWDPVRGQDMNTGGIWNHVELYSTPPVRIAALRITPELLRDGSAAVEVALTIENLGDRVATEVEIELLPDNFPGPGRSWGTGFRLPPGATVLRRVFIVEKPGLWWTWDHGEPRLYRAVARLGHPGGEGATRAERFGIRKLEVDKVRGWKLNGVRFFPRGTNFIPAQWLAEYDGEKIKRDIELLLAANVNAVRVHAHVTHPDFYRACDEAGIAVWQDFPLQWDYEESEEFYTNATRQLREMIELLYNHPCVVVWCCHNEPKRNKGKLDVVLARTAREADPSRHVEPRSDFQEHPYPGWYYGHWTMFAHAPGAPFVSEFGAQALPGPESMRRMLPPDKLWPPDWEAWAYHDFQYEQTFDVAGVEMGGSLEEFIANSQEYQYRLLKFAIEAYRRHPGMTGVFQFMFVDPWPAITWSVVDYWREPKLGYRALQLAFQPVLVSVTYGRTRFRSGERASPLFHAITVVNDLHRAFPGAELRLVLRGPAGEELVREEVRVDVPPAGRVEVVTPGMRKEMWCLPPAAPPGRYSLRVRLVHDGEVISENEEVFEVRPGP